MMDEDLPSMIQYDLRGDAAWITLDRPDKKNALHLGGWEEVADCLERASEEARVAVITGRGDAFCAGDDITILDSLDTAEDIEELCRHNFEVFQGIENTSVPVISAINGLAYGGGCEIVVASDLAVAVDGAKFALSEARIGASPGYAVDRVAIAGGRKHLMEMSLTGEPIDASTANEWGMINRVVPESELEAEVEELVDSIAKCPKRTISTIKAYANSNVAEADEFEKMVGRISYLLFSEGTQDAIRKFLDR